MIFIRLTSHISAFVFSHKINGVVIPFILVSDGRNESEISRLRWFASLYAHARSVENAIAKSYMIFHICNVREMFEQVACFILIHVTALKYSGIEFLHNNEHKENKNCGILQEYSKTV